MDRMAKPVTRELHNLAIAEGVSLSELYPRSNQDISIRFGSFEVVSSGLGVSILQYGDRGDTPKLHQTRLAYVDSGCHDHADQSFRDRTDFGCGGGSKAHGK